MKQTWVGRVACKMGFHLIVTSGGNSWSRWGGCLRCNEPWQWDNAHQSPSCCDGGA